MSEQAVNVDTMIERLRAVPSKEKACWRQQAVWKGDSVDRLPVIFGVPAPELDASPRLNLDECYHDPEKMLIEHLYGMVPIAESPADGIPSIRANTGTATLATIFGLEQLVFPDKMPWLQQRLTKQQISALEPKQFAEVAHLGIMPQVLSYQRHFIKRLDGSAPVYLSDTQGPFDIAHLVRGDALLTDMYDDPPFVHHLMELTTAVYVAATHAMKRNLEEPLDGGYHSNGLVLANGGVRICEDSPTILSPALLDEFVAPYTERALATFGGGYIHYCGKNDHLFKVLLAQPSVRGFNFGNPERHDVNTVMCELTASGKVYYGEWKRLEGEVMADYFRRVLAPLEGVKRSLIFCPSLTQEELKEPQRVMEIWANAQ